MAEIDRKKVIKGIEICSGITKESSEECPYWKALDMGCKSATCISTMMREPRTLLKEHEKEVQYLNEVIRRRDAIIEEYSKADGFLAAHGWRWENNETADT